MGRIITQVKVTNVLDTDKTISLDGLVDIGATYLTLPMIWKERLGKLEQVDEVEFELANGERGKGEVCGPVRIAVANFRQTFGEVLFIEMPANEHGEYEPLVGYLPLEAIPVAVDMLGHRLIKISAVDLK
jgi:predicted aspartyl protease